MTINQAFLYSSVTLEVFSFIKYLEKIYMYSSSDLYKYNATLLRYC